MNYIQNLPFAEDWEFEKMQHFNSELNQMTLLPGEVVYELNDPTDVFYLVKQGSLQVEAVVELEEENQFPVGNDKWEQHITKRQIEFQAHQIKPNEIFGL